MSFFNEIKKYLDQFFFFMSNVTEHIWLYFFGRNNESFYSDSEQIFAGVVTETTEMSSIELLEKKIIPVPSDEQFEIISNEMI
jgi:hypothetical protein